MEFEEGNPFNSGNGPSETQDMGLFSPHQPNNATTLGARQGGRLQEEVAYRRNQQDFGVTMEETPSSTLKDFDIEMSLFETSILEEPMSEALHSIATSSIPGSIPEILNLGESCHSPPGSDIWDSCPPSPVSSPSLLSSSSSSESGIEDISDIEEPSHLRTVMQSAVSTEQSGDNSQQPVVVKVKKEEPSSPLNTAITSDNFLERRNGDRKKRRISRKFRNASNISDATEELTRLIENISSAAQPSLQSPTDTTQTTVANVFSMAGSPGIQTPVLPSTQASCFPVTVQSNQVPIMASTSFASTSNVTSTATVTKTSCESLSTTQAIIRAKPNKSTKKTGEPKIVILEEPEENYRARYESEGCRGPIHGSTDNTFPTVQVAGVSDPLWITVHLITASGLPHYHSIHGPGSTKVPCKEISLPGGIPAVQVMVAPDTNMTAVLDSLSIRRLRNWEGDRELRKRGIDPRTWKKERKEAQLLFQAEIPGRDGHPSIKLMCKSKVFQCSSSGPPGNPEIWWASISEGSVEGGDELGLIGKKFQSGFKVRFYSQTSSGDVWESFAEVDRSKSHQGAAVALTPAYCDTSITSPVTVNVVVTFGTGSGVKSSEPIEFIYRPKAIIHAQEIEMHAANLSVTAPDSYLPEDLFACIGDVVLHELGSQMVEPSPVVVPAVSHQSDEQDWQALCIHISALHQKGLISSQHVKELCDYIRRRDTLLLQAFRSSRNASNTEELQANFKQYLSGMLCNL